MEYFDITRCNPLLENDPKEQRFYFVHSYYVKPNASELCIAKTLYGSEFCSAFNSDNIFGVQFHPKKLSIWNFFDEEICKYLRMLKHRVIPTLIQNGDLIKTCKFKNPQYIGDPVNAIKIFNEKEVDELIVLDVSKSKDKLEPDYALIEEFAGECFMPLTYGGGVKNIEQAGRIFRLGVEKICLNSLCFDNIETIKSMVNRFGSQSIVASQM